MAERGQRFRCVRDDLDDQYLQGQGGEEEPATAQLELGEGRQPAARERNRK